MIKSYRDLEVYQLSYGVAMAVFHLSRKFPKEEMYSLTSQVVRSSQSISSNITEGWGKRTYENNFKQQLITALGSYHETENWLSFAKDCRYISEEECQAYMHRLDQIGKMLTRLHQNWKS